MVVVVPYQSQQKALLGGTHGEIQIWDLRRLTKISSFLDPSGEKILSITVFNFDQLAAISNSNFISIFELDSGNLVAKLEQREVTYIEVKNDFMLSASKDGTIRHWRLKKIV